MNCQAIVILSVRPQGDIEPLMATALHAIHHAWLAQDRMSINVKCAKILQWRNTPDRRWGIRANVWRHVHCQHNFI